MSRNGDGRGRGSDMDWGSISEQVIQFATMILVAVVVAGLGISVIEFSRRRSLPFCNSFDDHSDLCRPCPPNGNCFEGSLECFQGFKNHGDSCKRDTDMIRSSQRLADYIEEHVCGMYGQSLCRETGITWPTVGDIYTLLSQSGLEDRLGLNPVRFTLATEKAMHIVRENLIVKETSNGLQQLQCPLDLAHKYKPISCRLKDWAFHNFMSILIFVPLVLLITIRFLRVYHKKKSFARANELYQQVCQALEDKSTSVNFEGETWVVASRLRDHLLRLNERKNTALWKKVEQMVQEDSRIDQYPRLIKGESKVVWEWQGLLTPSKS